MRNLGANIKAASIEKAGKTIGVVQEVCQAFEKQTSSYHSSDRHTVPKFGKDFDMILTALEEENVFVPIAKRHHESFKFKRGLMETFSNNILLSKVQTTIDYM